MTIDQHAPDPGNAGVGRGKKFYCIVHSTLVRLWFNVFLYIHFEKFISGINRPAIAYFGIGPVFRKRKSN
ncbi:hypothetical protein CLV57_3617 [Mucilaginibacter auburnensis]|uniref:Uncharacterized protein n=1 Tax=Mucilaginibacter auburnensis TaxID=1457233 RepID=A0A2H9VQ66_9SPHI|nr:hypothetical protein CLV57_3617 [Mucilaginibacter auburnensis]